MDLGSNNCSYACSCTCNTGELAPRVPVPWVPVPQILGSSVLKSFEDDPDDRQKIPVRRKHIWNDTKRALSRDVFQDKKGLSITFIVEPAVDDGGPLHEFFCLLMLEITSLFCGPEGRRTPTHNLLALQRNEYFFVGKCIALSISYGGPGPHFLCETNARYLCNEPVTTPELDVPDYEVRERIEKGRLYHVNVLI